MTHFVHYPKPDQKYKQDGERILGDAAQASAKSRLRSEVVIARRLSHGRNGLLCMPSPPAKAKRVN
jgi:hypothetical protein